MTFSPRSLNVRIALYFIGLLAAVQLITHLVVHQANDRIASAHTRAELDRGERVLRRSIEERGTRLQQAVRLLVSDFAFRKTVTAGDPATMQSALDNHGVRLGANAGLVISDTGRIVASFGLPASASPDTLSQLVKAIEQKEDQTWIALIGGKAFQFAVAPVLVPDPYGWVAFGFVLDDRVAADLKQLVDLEISFLAQDAAGQYIISASSLTLAQRQILQQQVARQTFTPGAWSAMNLAGHPYATSGVKLDNEPSVKAAALVQKSIEESIAPFQKISVVLSVVALIGALAGIICSVWIAGAIAKPIQVLTEVTNRIRRGEKLVTVPTHFAGEIGELATGFDQMNQEIEKREAEILRLAFVDPLTQLANRAGLMKAAVEAHNNVQRDALAQPNHGTVIAIALLDIARLQHINDGLGYSVGDRVIKAVASRLQKSARANETVARTQGDGFAWLMHDIDADAINRRLLTLIEDFAAHPIDIEDQTIDVQVHVGWALARSDQNDASEVFRRAEIALHAASVRQLSPIRHELSMDIDSGSQLGLLSELRNAVARDEFVLYYQPKLTLDGKPAGVEALVRWNHPTRGFLAPGAFIEFAEKTGNIRAITRRLIEHAAKQSARWGKMGLDICIAVNVSAHDLQDETFPQFVAKTLQDQGACADRLKLEITERALLENFAAAERALTQLGDTGIHTALDDYGTGYATLTHLSRLPVSELKIDRSFITDLTIDSRNFAIAITTVELAHRLGMRAVAEGVETVEELNALQKTGCDEVQGYLFGKPMSADSLTEWWKTRNVAYSTIKRVKDFV